MGWSINTVVNELKIPKGYQPRLEEVADENYHCIFFDDDGTIGFDSDAMEHMDFLHENWAQEIILESKANGMVIFGSLEGDNAGDFWGYNFVNGKVEELSKKLCLEVLMERA